MILASTFCWQSFRNRVDFWNSQGYTCVYIFRVQVEGISWWLPSVSVWSVPSPSRWWSVPWRTDIVDTAMIRRVLRAWLRIELEKQGRHICTSTLSAQFQLLVQYSVYVLLLDTPLTINCCLPIGARYRDVQTIFRWQCWTWVLISLWWKWLMPKPSPDNTFVWSVTVEEHQYKIVIKNIALCVSGRIYKMLLPNIFSKRKVVSHYHLATIFIYESCISIYCYYWIYQHLQALITTTHGQLVACDGGTLLW